MTPDQGNHVTELAELYVATLTPPRQTQGIYLNDPRSTPKAIQRL
jgi:hypothetical protein